MTWIHVTQPCGACGGKGRVTEVLRVPLAPSMSLESSLGCPACGGGGTGTRSVLVASAAVTRESWVEWTEAEFPANVLTLMNRTDDDLLEQAHVAAMQRRRNQQAYCLWLFDQMAEPCERIHDCSVVERGGLCFACGLKGSHDEPARAMAQKFCPSCRGKGSVVRVEVAGERDCDYCGSRVELGGEDAWCACPITITSIRRATKREIEAAQTLCEACDGTVGTSRRESGLLVSFIQCEPCGNRGYTGPEYDPETLVPLGEIAP